MARRRRGTAGGRRHARHGADRDQRGRRAAARPRRRQPAALPDRGRARRAAGGRRHRVPRRPRALDRGAGGGGGQPPWSASTSPTSPIATSRASCRCCGPTSSSTAAWPTSTAPVRRPRPRRRCCTALLGSGRLRVCRCRASTRLFFVFIPVALAFALVVLARPAGRACSSPPRSRSTGRWRAASYFMLPSLGPIYADAGRLRAPPRHRRQAACRRPCSTHGPSSCATRRRRRRPEHRRLRLAARLDLLHRGAGDAPARARRAL